MKKLSKILLVTLCALTVVFTTNTADARRGTKLRMGFAISTNHSIGQGYLKFKELVELKSNGSMQVEVFGNAVLGNDRTLGEAVQSGTLDLVSLPTPALAGFHKTFMALDLPYITEAENSKKFQEGLDNGALGEYLRGVANSIGLEPLMYSEYGYRNFQTVDRKITQLSDLRGLKIRTTDSPIEVAIAKAFGMNPAPIAWSEVYTALSQGVVEAVSNTAAMSHEAKHSELLKFAIDSKHNYSMHHLFMNKRKWNNLNDEQRTIITDAAREANAWQRELAGKKELETIELFKSRGIVMIELDEAEKQKLIDVTQGVRDQFIEELPSELITLIKETQQ